MRRFTWFCGWCLIALSTVACRMDGAGKPVQPIDKKPINYWELYKENCEDVLRDPYAFDLSRVLHCTKVWEMYQEVSDLSTNMRSMYATGFSRVYHESSGNSRVIAQAALQRICIPAHPLGIDGKVTEKPPEKLDCGGGSPFLDIKEARSPQQESMAAIATQAKESPEIASALKLAKRRAIIDPTTPAKGRVSQAQSEYRQGRKHFRSKQYAKAVPHYEKALQLHPFHIPSKYEMAASFAILGERERAIKELSDLYMWNSPEVTQTLRAARSDDRLAPIRDDVRFKLMTGYRRITLLNGAGEPALPAFDRLATEITAKGYPLDPSRVGNDKNIRLYPVIYYRPLFKEEAEEFRVLVADKSTRLIQINWETRDDFVVVWGEQAAAALFAADSQSEPIVQGTPAEAEPAKGLGDVMADVQAAKDEAGAAKASAEETATVPP